MTAPNIEVIAQELHRGAVVLAVLARLTVEQYGYSLRERLSAAGLEVPEGTLYPLLRRLEQQGLLESRWQLGEGRPRRYYRTSQGGRAAVVELEHEWRSLVDAMNRVLRPEEAPWS